jgi:hypothetical protein
MRAVSVLLLLISLAAGASAQTPTPAQDCPCLLVQDYAWGVARRDVSREDPRFKASSSDRPINTKDNPINTVGNPVNMVGVPVNTAPVRPAGGPPGSQVPISRNSEMVEQVEVRRETYMLVKNSGDKIIKTIKWDYVFFSDPAMEREVRRHKFQSKKKIEPGEAKFLSEYVFKRAPSRYQKVFINRIEFKDGSVWERTGPTLN